MSRLNHLWHSFEPLPCILLLDTREKSSAPTSLHPLLRTLQRVLMLPLNLFFSILDKPRVFSWSLQDMPSIPFTSFVSLLWTHSSTFLNCATQNSFSIQEEIVPTPNKVGVNWLFMLCLESWNHLR